VFSARLEETKDTPFELIFLDINMPGLSGYETSVRLHEIMDHHQLHGCTIVGLTGDTSEEIVRASQASGMAHVLTKPISKAEIARFLSDHFKTEPPI